MIIRNLDIDVDLPLILSSWIRTVRPRNFFRSLSNSAITNHVETVIKPLISCEEVLVACDNQHQDQIFGYIVGNQSLRIMHMVYMRITFRRFGYATELARELFGAIGDDADAIMYTHPAKMVGVLRKKWNLIFNPYQILECIHGAV